MDSTVTTPTSPSRIEAKPRLASQSQSQGKERIEKKREAIPEPKPTDYGVTVKGRFDADLRRYFVTISDTSSGSLILQFPSRAAAQYAQQIAKSAGKREPDPTEPERAEKPEDRLDQTT